MNITRDYRNRGLLPARMIPLERPITREGRRLNLQTWFKIGRRENTFAIFQHGGLSWETHFFIVEIGVRIR